MDASLVEVRFEILDPHDYFPCPVTRDRVALRFGSGERPPTIGHDLYVALAHRPDGQWRTGFPENVIGARDLLLAVAADNLARIAREGELTINVGEGPRGLPYMVFGADHWLGSSGIFLPELERFLVRDLGEGPFCASIPHRGSMITFREMDAPYRAEMRAFIAAVEADNANPRLTNELFRITSSGVVPLIETDPDDGASEEAS